MENSWKINKNCRECSFLTRMDRSLSPLFSCSSQVHTAACPAALAELLSNYLPKTQELPATENVKMFGLFSEVKKHLRSFKSFHEDMFSTVFFIRFDKLSESELFFFNESKLPGQ